MMMFWTSSNCNIETRIAGATDIFFEKAFAKARDVAGKGSLPTFAHLRDGMLSLGNQIAFVADKRLNPQKATDNPFGPIIRFSDTLELPSVNNLLSKHPFDFSHSMSHAVGWLAMAPFDYGEIGIPATDLSFYGVDFVEYIKGIFSEIEIKPMNYSLADIESYTNHSVKHYTRDENLSLFKIKPKSLDRIVDNVKKDQVGISIGQVLKLTARGLVVRNKVEQEVGCGLNNLKFDQFYNCSSILLQLTKDEEKLIKDLSTERTFPKPILSGNFSSIRIFVSGLRDEYNSRK